jgi:hypothetical protein
MLHRDGDTSCSSASGTRPASARTLARRPRDGADLKSASGKPECRLESGRGHHIEHLCPPDAVPPQSQEHTNFLYSC